ncbi:Lrp/AsnC family transcriptional regulator [Leifsonia aquatica]|uniref:Lrp/AsnC family transcriptional regulator n=1 Tax=Leifsonia aquatica TaxID=144185 RepID=UPI000AE2476C
MIDAIDWKILAELQQDGRLSITDLAERVTLSTSPAHRRLRALESAGVISGYHAEVDLGLLGFGFESLLFVTMRVTDKPTIEAFEEAVKAVPEVLQAQRLFGDPDYLLRVVCRDLTAFQELYDETISNIPGVGRLETTLVMKNVVSGRSLPLRPSGERNRPSGR